jgi:hypothetical protein
MSGLDAAARFLAETRMVCERVTQGTLFAINESLLPSRMGSCP